MSEVVVVVIILLVLLWLVYYTKKPKNNPVVELFENIKTSAGKKYKEYTATPEELYTGIVGYTNDSLSKLIIDKTLKKEKMYEVNENNGGISANKYNDAVNNIFTLGQVLRYNTDNEREDEVQRFYNRTLQRVLRQPRLVDNPEYIVNRIEDYLVPTEEEYYFIHDTLNNARLERAVDRAAGGATEIVPKQNVLEYYYETTQVPNDPQNVHETNVVYGLKSIYDNIVEKNGGKVTADIGEIEKKINDLQSKNKISAQQATRAKKTLETMRNKNYVSSLGTDESAVLQNVWNRVHSRENAANVQNLELSFVNSLAECQEPDWQGNDQQVCTVGRVSRVINSLSQMDADEDISAPVVTTEVLRNEIFSKTYAIIQEELKSADVDVARKYNGLPGDYAPEIDARVEEFEENLKLKITNTIQSEYSDAKPETLRTIIQEALAGV